MNAETPLAPLFAVALHAENLDVQARFDYLEFPMSFGIRRQPSETLTRD